MRVNEKRKEMNEIERRRSFCVDASCGVAPFLWNRFKGPRVSKLFQQKMIIEIFFFKDYYFLEQIKQRTAERTKVNFENSFGRV